MSPVPRGWPRRIRLALTPVVLADGDAAVSLGHPEGSIPLTASVPKNSRGSTPGMLFSRESGHRGPRADRGEDLSSSSLSAGVNANLRVLDAGRSGPEQRQVAHTLYHGARPRRAAPGTIAEPQTLRRGRDRRKGPTSC